MKKLTGLIGAALLAASSLASANPIFYEVENLGGDRWQYNYTVGNETGADIDWFTIWFDPDLYEFDLVEDEFGAFVDPGSYVEPDGWFVIVAAPDPFFPGPADDAFGFYDGFALGDPVAPGSLVSGFSMIFTWLGTGTPGSQPFTLGGDWLPTDLFTEPLVAGPVGVPEPGSLGLLGVSVALFGFARRALARG